MVLPQRKHPRLKNYDYAQNGCYFITICTKNRKRLFWDAGRDDFIPPQYALSSLGVIVKRHIESIPSAYPNVFIDNYVIMPNHVHMLLRIDGLLQSDAGDAPHRPVLSTMIHGLKSLTTRKAGFPLWQDSFYEHVIRSDADYQAIWNYIEDNPRKWSEDCYHTE